MLPPYRRGATAEQVDALWAALKLRFSKIGIFLTATVGFVSGLTMPCETAGDSSVQKPS